MTLQDDGEKSTKVLPREIREIIKRRGGLPKEPVCTRDGRCIHCLDFGETDKMNVLCDANGRAGYKYTPRTSCRDKELPEEFPTPKP